MFRFTIRDVLWLTVVVAMGAGWWLTARRLSEVQRHLSEVEAKRNELQTALETISEEWAKSNLDATFRRAYDGPLPRRP